MATVLLSECVPATPRTRLLRLTLTEGTFVFRAGQAVLAGLVGSATRSAYSIASPPSLAARGTLELLVPADGAFGEAGLDPATVVGRALTIDGPLGTFGVPPAAENAPLLLVGGGTGIAPLRSMILETIHGARQGGLALVYSARTPTEFAYLDELRGFAEGGRLSLTLTLTGDAQDWSHSRGRTGAHHLSDLVTPRTLAFVCGPPAMVAEIPAALISLGLPRERVRTEDW